MTHKIACGNGSCGCPPGGAVVQQADRPSRLALGSVLVAGLGVMVAAAVAWPARLSAPVGSAALHVRHAFCTYDGTLQPFQPTSTATVRHSPVPCSTVPGRPRPLDGWRRSSMELGQPSGDDSGIHDCQP
jgi:hypothetical protein